MSNDDIKGQFAGHYPCPNCGSVDNLAVYLKEIDNVDSYDASCFGCKKFYNHDELIESGVLSEDYVVDKTKLKAPKERITKSEYQGIKSCTNTSGKLQDGSQYRSQSDWALDFYGHRFERDPKGRIKAVYYPETKGGKLQGYKSRHLPKRFGINNIGRTGGRNDLSGQHKFTSGGKYVIIVGGEEDKVAAQTMFRDYQISKGQDKYDPYAVVSPTTGEGSAVKQCAANYDFLDSFEFIVVCMDNDDAGRAATEELVKVLPEDKVKIMSLSGKDPNQMLQDGRQKQFMSNFFNAKELISSGIKSSVSLMDDVEDVLTAETITLPPYMNKLQKAMKRAFSKNGRVVNFIGSTSVGKSTHVNAMVYHWAMSKDMKPLVMSLEMTGGEYAVDLLSLHLGKNLDWFEDGHDAVDYLNHPDVKSLYTNLFEDETGEERFKIVDEGVVSLKLIEKQIDRAVKQYDCNIIVIDVLSDILRFLPIEEQQRHMAWQKNFVKGGCSILNVLHTKKLDTDKDGKTKFATEFDALGTSSFVQSAHINIVANRDKMAENDVERNTTYIDMPKCRRGKTGRICEWVYDPKTRQVYDKEDYLKLEHGVPLVDNENESVDSEEGSIVMELGF